jgi:tRNA(Ile)-lysidine synthase
VHFLAQRFLEQIMREELLHPGDRVGIAVSGGIDSVALLRLMLELRHELGIVLSVVHFNHKLRGAESDADEEFVANLAPEHDLEFHSESGNVVELAAEEHSGIEAAARVLRYEFFRKLLGADGSGPQGLKPESLMHVSGAAEAAPLQNSAHAGQSAGLPFIEPPLDKIATGHTADDQAETVLMRLIRGTGLRGLGAIHPRVIVDNEDGAGQEGHGEIIRPLLGIRRRELKQYLTDLKQPWREDSTNSDSRFTRNRVRKLVLPLLEREFNPAVVESLSELAEIARDEEDYWENEVSGWLGTVVQWSQPEWTYGLPGFENTDGLVQIQPSHPAQADPELLARIEQSGSSIVNASVSRPWLLTEPRAVQRRVLKAIGEQVGVALEFKHIEEILRFAAEDGSSGKQLSLPLGWKILREAEAIVFLTPDLRRQEGAPDYEYSLPVPGRVLVAELRVVIEAMRVAPELQMAEYNPQQLLRAELLPDRLTLRNWRPGDRFRPAYTKSAKKIKDLLQERHVAQPERRLWPVALNADEIVWMRGFPVPAKFRADSTAVAVLIRVTAWGLEQLTI